VSGAGGELRPSNIQQKLRGAHIAWWCGQNHFLVVEIDGRSLRITPVGFEPLRIVDADGKMAQTPFAVNLP
jgi:hypothetical protein